MTFNKSTYVAVGALSVSPLHDSPIRVGLAGEDDFWDVAADQLHGYVGCWAAGGGIEDVAGNRVFRRGRHLGLARLIYIDRK